MDVGLWTRRGPWLSWSPKLKIAGIGTCLWDPRGEALRDGAAGSGVSGERQTAGGGTSWSSAACSCTLSFKPLRCQTASLFFTHTKKKKDGFTTALKNERMCNKRQGNSCMKQGKKKKKKEGGGSWFTERGVRDSHRKRWPNREWVCVRFSESGRWAFSGNNRFIGSSWA